MISLIKKRRSIRVFQNKSVEKEKIDRIVQAALLSPSSKNNNPWIFIVLDDKELLFKLSKAKTHGSQFIKNAPLAFIVLADPNQSDVWIEDCSITATMIIMTAQALGLGSCWVQIRKRRNPDNQDSEEFIRNLLGIPGNLRVLCMVAIGYPDEKKPEKEIEEAKLNDVYLNSFGNKNRIAIKD